MVCSKEECNIEARQGQRYCNKCHAEYMRNNRPKHSELKEEQKKKANARSYLNTYIRRGKILRQPCEVCSSPIAEGHHKDLL